MGNYHDLEQAINLSIAQLKQYGITVDTGHWQGVTTEGKPDLVTKEIVNLDWSAPMPLDPMRLAKLTGASWPWAENHFQERVSRVPSNPGEQYLNWPWWRGQDAESMDDSGHELKFSHTYQERFWSKLAGNPEYREDDGQRQAMWNRGIRYDYGDLDDVVNLLRREPYTRQATFPIFFPEDTGAVHGGRVPCTLHYHFLLRQNRLHLWYPIRSCDAVRHFRDDVYMAVRLCHWVIEQLRTEPEVQGEYDLWRDVEPGWLYFTAYSFHVHMGDIHLL